MNSFIENLNQWGGDFLSFAWPMLWQSSLLIVVLFAIDFLMPAQNSRFDPLCALAGGAGETLPAADPGVADQPGLVVVPKVRRRLRPCRITRVTYDTGRLPEISRNPPPVFVPPKPAMTAAAWLLLAAGCECSVLLFAWLLVRWWQIARRARRSTHSERIDGLAQRNRGFWPVRSSIVAG